MYEGTEIRTPDGEGDAQLKDSVYFDFILDVLLWKGKVRSTLYLAGGWIFLGFCYDISSNSVKFFTTICHFLLCGLAALLFVDLVMAKYRADIIQWKTATMTKIVTTGVLCYAQIVVFIESNLGGNNPWKTFKAIMVLWFLSLVSRHFSLLSILFLCHIFAFAIPAAYVSSKVVVENALAYMNKKLQKGISHLNSWAIVGGLIVFGVIALTVLPRIDRLVFLMVVIKYFQCVLKPEEINHIQQLLSPFGGTIYSIFVTSKQILASVAKEYELVPTIHIRKLRNE